MLQMSLFASKFSWRSPLQNIFSFFHPNPLPCLRQGIPTTNITTIAYAIDIWFPLILIKGLKHPSPYLHTQYTFSLLFIWWPWNIVFVSKFTFNSMVPGRTGCNLKLIIFKLMSRVGILSISYEIALKRMPQDFTDDKSIMVQVMAWCHQATSHYLSQCWPRSMLPYGVIRPQWVKWKQTIKTWNISCKLTSQIIKVGYWYLSTIKGGRNVLTHWGLVIPLCISQHDHHWSRKCIDSEPNHYFNHCWFIICFVH